MKRNTKDIIYEQLARTTKALSNPNRIEILDLLSQGEKTVETIAEETGLRIKNASAQLKELKSALLVDARKEGKYVFYRTSDPTVSSFLISLRQFSEGKFTELQKVVAETFQDTKDLVPVNRKELLSQLKKGSAILLDVRPHDEYEYAHLPFAHSVPLSELKNELKNLPKDKEIIAYCRGPYCFLAKEAVEALRKKGFRARRLSDSVDEWASFGLPVQRAKEA